MNDDLINNFCKNNNFKQIKGKDLKFVKDIRGIFFKTIRDFALIEKNDRVAVGLSGGKDSMTTLDLLSIYHKYINPDFTLNAIYIHVDNAPYQIDFEAVENFCNIRQIPLKVKHVTLEDKRDNKNRCFICSWTRRKALFEFTKELDINKLVLGHNMNDAAETLLINQFYHGEISSLPVKLKMFDGRIFLIRPLLQITNNQALTYANLYDFPKIKSACGFEKSSIRNKFREIITTFESQNKAVVKNLFNSMDNYNQEYLFHNYDFYGDKN